MSSVLRIYLLIQMNYANNVYDVFLNYRVELCHCVGLVDGHTGISLAWILFGSWIVGIEAALGPGPEMVYKYTQGLCEYSLYSE